MRGIHLEMICLPKDEKAKSDVLGEFRDGNHVSPKTWLTVLLAFFTNILSFMHFITPKGV